MTTEDDFQAALDADPTDWQTRLVFADWLQERGDPRAEGYRALGRWRRNPERRRAYPSRTYWAWSWTTPESWPRAEYQCFPQCLSYDWWTALQDLCPQKLEWNTRREAEDDAALAFVQLAPERRAELLAGPRPEPRENRRPLRR